MKRLRALEKFKLEQLEAAQLKKVIEEEEAQNELKHTAERRLQENRIRKRLIQNLERFRCRGRTDLEIQLRDPLDGSQSKKEFSL